MKSLGLLFCTIACVAVAANAEQVTLKNGDKITGTVVKSDGKTLVFKTDYAGDLSISWAAIQDLSSDKKLFVATPDQETGIGHGDDAGCRSRGHNCAGRRARSEGLRRTDSLGRRAGSLRGFAASSANQELGGRIELGIRSLTRQQRYQKRQLGTYGCAYHQQRQDCTLCQLAVLDE